MTTRTLVLSPWYFPQTIIGWRHAVTWLYLGKAQVVASYGEEICSPSTRMHTPAVVRMVRDVAISRRSAKFSRGNVYLRDDFTCGYCGRQLPADKLTVDHVVPRARGGRTEWENIVTACSWCNATKGPRTPEEAGMYPRREPVRPVSLPLYPPLIDPTSAPPEWRDYCAAPPSVVTV